jgi:hypothetical protein
LRKIKMTERRLSGVLHRAAAAATLAVIARVNTTLGFVRRLAAQGGPFPSGTVFVFPSVFAF